MGAKRTLPLGSNSIFVYISSCESDFIFPELKGAFLEE
jgi:hypothetical protein